MSALPRYSNEIDPERIEKRAKELMTLPEYDPLQADNFAEIVQEMDRKDLQKICDLMRDRCALTDEAAVSQLWLATWSHYFPIAYREATAEIEEEMEDKQ